MAERVNLAAKILPNPKVKRFLDLNTDLGQRRDQAFFKQTDYALLNHVTSVSIPCAVHDGDPKEILESIRQAKRYNCVIGAHIGFPDPARYGYEPMVLPDEDLIAWLYVQIGAFQALLRSEALDIEFVRPHGALYSALINNPPVAFALARAIHQISAWFVLVGPAGSLLDQIASEVGLRTAPEIYLGKRYDPEGQPVLSGMPEFLPPQGVMDQARQFIQHGTLTSETGTAVSVKGKTLHISPVLPQAVQVAEKISQLLIQPVSLPLADIAASGWL